MEINGYPNYLIYEDGRVWSKNYNRFLKPYLNNTNGYYQIGFFNNNKRKAFSIHRLIALHYIPNPNNYETVDHIDRDKQNNNINNLRWASRTMQQSNRKVHSNTGEKHIYKSKYLYEIQKKYCFSEYLNCEKYTLDDAINLRDSLLSLYN